jgi:hypothetical protein
LPHSSPLSVEGELKVCTPKADSNRRGSDVKLSYQQVPLLFLNRGDDFSVNLTEKMEGWYLVVFGQPVFDDS